MLRVASLVLLSSCLAYGQHDAQAQTQHPQDRHNMVTEQGDKVMGFSHEKTMHHFVLTQDGGLIEARVNDLKDAASLGEIRDHFQHIIRMFADGNFNAPILVHSQACPAWLS